MTDMKKPSPRAVLLAVVLIAALVVGGILYVNQNRTVGTILPDGKIIYDHELYIEDDNPAVYERGRRLGMAANDETRLTIYDVEEADGAYIEAVRGDGQSALYKRVDGLPDAQTTEEKGG
ncbi:MAG: hypothetical protein IKQ92_00625 [Clostridia bacterium]|nr:hypothetical protein [Clostridia bacterium]